MSISHPANATHTHMIHKAHFSFAFSIKAFRPTMSTMPTIWFQKHELRDKHNADCRALPLGGYRRTCPPVIRYPDGTASPIGYEISHDNSKPSGRTGMRVNPSSEASTSKDQNLWRFRAP